MILETGILNVAQVLDTFKEETSRSRLNGLPAVNIAVKKRSGENIIAIADAVEEILQQRLAGVARQGLFSGRPARPAGRAAPRSPR